MILLSQTDTEKGLQSGKCLEMSKKLFVSESGKKMARNFFIMHSLVAIYHHIDIFKVFISDDFPLLLFLEY